MTSPPPDAAPDLESEINGAGTALHEGLTHLLDSLPEAPRGPMALSRCVGVDKVLASRVLKAVRVGDPMTVIYRMPGPDPLRRLIRAAEDRGADADGVARAGAAVDRFERLIRVRIGDRSTLDTIVAAWVPEARREFELRRKQSAFKAMSQLRGAQARTIVSTVLLAPSADGERIDIVWASGFVGMQRLRPGAAVKFATRRIADGEAERRATTLDGAPITGFASTRLDAFCSQPAPLVVTETAGNATHYALGGSAFGPRSAVDIICAEVNRAEIRRTVPRGSGRKGWLFAETALPAERLQFDAFVHEGIWPGSLPRLLLYDTAFEGVADVNDRSRDADRIDLLESIDPLPRGLAAARSADVPRYHELLRTLHERLGWDPERFRGHRCRIEYPVYGSQVAMAFDPPEA